MAALQAARGEPDASPPELLQMAWHCKRWNALPETGGLNDQPAGMLNKMAILMDVYAAANGYYGATDTVKWAEANERAWELYAWARQIEKQHG